MSLGLGRKKKDKDKEFSTGLTINYINEAHLGDTLDCYLFADRVYVTRTSNSEEDKTIVYLIAK